MPMTRKQKTDLLKQVELFSGVSPRALGSIADRAVDVAFSSGQYIVRQGQVGTGFYLIVSGQVRIERGGDVVARMGSGQFFGELSVLDQAPRIAHVIAEEPTVCLALASWDFTKLLERNPKLTLSILREVARRLRAVTDHPHH